MTVGDLFAGIGGFSLGLERAGMTIAWQCEIDPFCLAVLAKHWPSVRKYADIRTLGDDLPRVDLLCGGFPCQDISDNGHRAGLSGADSGLWREMVRTVRLVGPRYVLVENVASLLHRGMGEVVGDLAALGYRVEWDCVPASRFGAPHDRERVFLIAVRLWVPVTFAAELPLCDCCEEPWCEEHDEHFWACGCPGPHSAIEDGWDVREESGRLVAYPARGGVEGHGASRIEIAPAPGGPLVLGCGDAGDRTTEWDVEPRVVRLVHGVSAGVYGDRFRALGNAVCPPIAQWIGERILAHEAATR